MSFRHSSRISLYGRVFALSVVAGLLAVSTNARASGLTLQAIGSETGKWSSNPLLSVNKPEAMMGSTTSPELILKNTTPLSQFSFDAKLDENIFDRAAFNSTDAHATTSIATQNQHWSLQFQQTTDYDTTRTSELTGFGVTDKAIHHLGLNFAPQISYRPSELNSFSLSGSAYKSRYDSDSYTNYETFSAMPAYTRLLDQRNAAIVRVQAQRYRTTSDSSVRIDSLSPSVGWQSTLSPRFTANAFVGAQTSRQYSFGTAVTPWQWTYTFSGGLSFKGVQDTLNFVSTRSQFPYGDGTEALQTSFALTGSHALNPAISLNYGANYLISHYQVVTYGSQKSLTGGSVGATYHATQQVDLTATYQYRYETLTNEKRAARDNSVMLGLTLRPQAWLLVE